MKRRGGTFFSSAAGASSGLSDSGAASAASAASTFGHSSATHRQSPHSGSGARSGASGTGSSSEIRFDSAPASADEMNSKSDKMRDIARKRRFWLVSYVLPRAAFCALLLVFLRALAYRLGDDVVLPDKGSVLPLPPTLQQDLLGGDGPHLTLSDDDDDDDAAGAPRRLEPDVKTRRRTNKVLAVGSRDDTGNTDASAPGHHRVNPGFGRHHVVTEGLLHHALVKASNEYGPRVPRRSSRGIHGPLSELERQGHDVRHYFDENGQHTKVTHCKEYLGDHIHCKPVLDMTVLRAVQTFWGMSDKLFTSSISTEKIKWKDAFEVGLDTKFMRDRLIEVAHNYQLSPNKDELRADAGDDLDLSHGAHSTDAGTAEHAWRYRKAIRRAYYGRHASKDDG